MQSTLEHRLVGDIYDAALKNELWSSVIGNLVRLARASKGNLLAYDRLNPNYFLFHSNGVTAEQLQHYQDGGFAALDQEFTCQWVSNVGEVTANHYAFPDINEFKCKAGRLYTEFFSQVGILYQSGAVLEQEEFRWSVLGLHRDEQGGPFEDDVIASISQLVPHLRRALQIHRQIALLNQSNTHLYQLFDRFTVGVFLLDGNGRIRYANRHAEAVLKLDDSLQATSQHQLIAISPAQNNELQRAIIAATSASRRENLSCVAGGVVGLQRPGKSPLVLTVTPLSEFAGYEELAHDGIVAALFINDPETGHVLARELLRKSYALSERESDVCQAFLNEPSILRVAEHCGISENTTRSYLKNIYEKTGQHSQAELMRLLMGLTVDFEHVR